MSHLQRGDTIVFATHNAAKIRELDELLAPFRMTVASAGALGLPCQQIPILNPPEPIRSRQRAASSGSAARYGTWFGMVAVPVLNFCGRLSSGHWKSNTREYSQVGVTSIVARSRRSRRDKFLGQRNVTRAPRWSSSGR